MGKVLIGVIGLVVGLGAGAIFGGSVIGGTAAGVGIATGLGTGVCVTMRAAQDEELLTPEQVDQVLNRAAASLAGAAGTEPEGQAYGSAAECDAFLARLREAGSE